MSVAVPEEAGTSLQRGLSEWWNEETEYVYQRIERWAAFARGYNRLRSQKLSRGRLTMQEDQEPRWSIAANKLVVDGPTWNPRFRALKRSRRQKSRPEETRINCCGSFSYQSNSRLDSTCLETYRYDHSIYFKTIGEIRSSGKNSCSEGLPPSGDPEDLDWESKSVGTLEKQSLEDEVDNNNGTDAVGFCGDADVELRTSWIGSEQSSQIWPFVDSAEVEATVDNEKSLNCGGQVNSESKDVDELEETKRSNYEVAEQKIVGSPMEIDENLCHRTDCTVLDNQEDIKRIGGGRKSKRSPKRVWQPAVIGENHVMWPGVLLNYTRNVDPAVSPHNRAMVQ